MKYKILPQIIIYLFCILLFSQASFSADLLPLNGIWKFQYGDNRAWSHVDFDDSDWQHVKVPSLIKQLDNKPIDGWYRLKFDADFQFDKPPALLIDSIRHVDETWLNGVRIGGKGVFEKPWSFTQTNPIELPRVYSIPEGLLERNNNVLAIHTNIGFGMSQGAMFPGGAGILRGGLYLGNPDNLENYLQKKLISINSIDVIFFTLGLVEIFIILFLLRDSIHIFPEFPWLLFTSIIMLLGTAGHDFFYIHNIQWISINLILIISLLCMPLSVALYFLAQYQNIPKFWVKMIVLIWGVSSLLIIIPTISSHLKNTIWYIWMLTAIIFFFYALLCALIGVYEKRIGAYMQLFGVIIFLISIRTQWLPDAFLGHRNVQIGSMIYRYALLFAYFQKIKYMQIDYKNISKRVIKIADDIYSDIARELHDGIGQHLASLKLQVKLASLQGKNTHLNNINTELNKSLVDFRRLLSGLHPVLIDQHDIATALKLESLHKKKTCGINIELRISKLKLDKHFEHHLFRIYQECMNNAIRHGKADNIKLKLYQKENKIILSISDNGKGFDSLKIAKENTSGGLGLVSLKERVSLLGGRITIRNNKPKGTNILIIFPI